MSYINIVFNLSRAFSKEYTTAELSIAGFPLQVFRKINKVRILKLKTKIQLLFVRVSTEGVFWAQAS